MDQEEKAVPGQRHGDGKAQVGGGVQMSLAGAEGQVGERNVNLHLLSICLVSGIVSGPLTISSQYPE